MSPSEMVLALLFGRLPRIANAFVEAAAYGGASHCIALKKASQESPPKTSAELAELVEKTFTGQPEDARATRVQVTEGRVWFTSLAGTEVILEPIMNEEFILSVTGSQEAVLSRTKLTRASWHYCSLSVTVPQAQASLLEEKNPLREYVKQKREAASNSETAFLILPNLRWCLSPRSLRDRAFALEMSLQRHRREGGVGRTRCAEQAANQVHVDAHTLELYAKGDIGHAQRAEVERHLSSCSVCEDLMKSKMNSTARRSYEDRVAWQRLYSIPLAELVFLQGHVTAQGLSRYVEGNMGYEEMIILENHLGRCTTCFNKLPATDLGNWLRKAIDTKKSC
jgi:hypothetical protein